MTIISAARAPAWRRPASGIRWRAAAGLAGMLAGVFVVTGAFLPWVETFAGLIQIPGVRGSNGRIMVAAGVLIAAAGLLHLVRGGLRSRWLIGVAGFAAAGFSGYLLIQLAATARALSGDSMVLASGGPGLWVTGGGGVLAFATLFLPSPAAPAAQHGWAARAGRLRAGVLAWTGDVESQGARRGLQVALGLVWLVDAGLQFQPYMFGSAFVSQVLAPAQDGNPAWVAGRALWAGQLIGHDVPAWNSVFALIQLVIAVGLLWRPTVRAALAGSVIWALSVWWLGEGLGGLLTGSASPVTGAPGAVILYALLAVLAWPRRSSSLARRGGSRTDIATASPLGAGGSRAAWLLLWGSFAYLIVQPAVRAPDALRTAIAGNAAGEPGWLAALDVRVAAAIGAQGTLACAVLAVVFVLIGAGILVPGTTRAALLLAVVAGLAVWVVGENFGMVFTGMATDPGSGPLLILLAAAYWPVPVPEAGPTPSIPRIEASGAVRPPL